MGFLAKSSTIINLHEGIISLWSGLPETKESDENTKSIRLSCDHDTLSPRSAVLVPGKADFSASIERVAEGNVKLPLQKRHWTCKIPHIDGEVIVFTCS